VEVVLRGPSAGEAGELNEVDEAAEKDLDEVEDEEG
jgi:hypothetical protein